MWNPFRRKRKVPKPVLGVDPQLHLRAIHLVKTAKNGRHGASSPKEMQAAAQALGALAPGKTISRPTQEAKPVSKPVPKAKPQSVSKPRMPASQRLASVLKNVKGSDAQVLNALKSNPRFRSTLVKQLVSAKLNNPETLLEKIVKEMESGKGFQEIIEQLEQAKA